MTVIEDIELLYDLFSECYFCHTLLVKIRHQSQPRRESREASHLDVRSDPCIKQRKAWMGPYLATGHHREGT